MYNFNNFLSYFTDWNIEKMSKFSLSFSKTIEKKKLLPSVIKDDLPKAKNIVLENIESVEGNVIKTYVYLLMFLYINLILG